MNERVIDVPSLENTIPINDLTNIGLAVAQLGCTTKENFPSENRDQSSSCNETPLQNITNTDSSRNVQEYAEVPRQEVVGGNNPRIFNYVYQILMQDGEGEFLIKAYDFEVKQKQNKQSVPIGKTLPFSIHHVARIVLFHEIKVTRSYTISPERLDDLAASAFQLFPIYSKERFYVNRTKDSNAHGAFQSFYDTLRDKAITIGEIVVSRKRKHTENDSTFPSSLESLVAPLNIIDQNYIQKWTEANKSDKSRFYRQSDLEKIVSTLSNLVNPLGYLLIEADFCSIFEKPADLFETNWPLWAKKIISLAESRKVKDKTIRTILSDNIKISDNNVPILALVLLPFLFKKIQKLTKKSNYGKSWFPDKKQVLDTFIYHIKETGDLNKSINEAKCNVNLIYESHKLDVHPYVIIYGTSLINITSSYVVFGKYVYQLGTVQSAVDVCFKLIKVFQKSFSPVCNHIWNFLEICIYKFDVNDKYATLTELVDELKDR